MKIEVVYALPDQQMLMVIDIDSPDVTLDMAIQQSGLLTQFPEINLTSCKVGIFGKVKKLTDTLREGDRVEIYRPLIADPKEMRRERASQGKKMRKGGGKAEDA